MKTYLVAIGAFFMAGASPLLTQTSSSLATHTGIDLTGNAPPTEQGFPGIAGSSGGNVSKGEQFGYALPWSINIRRVSPDPGGNFIVNILIQNTGKISVDFPIYRNLTAVENLGIRISVFFLWHPISVFPCSLCRCH